MTTSAGSTHLRAFGASHVGRRRTNNEDRFHVDVARGIFIVVDGVGGQAAGDRAADTALSVLVDRLERETGDPRDRMREALTIANNEVHRLAMSRPAWRGMACVATAVLVTGEQAVVGHVGDSRLYRLRPGLIEKITPDHSPVGEREDAHEMSELEAMQHPRRNEVYRDIGSEARTFFDPQFAFVATIDVPAGCALLLCSDGLTDLVPSAAIRDIADRHAGAPQATVHALIDAANDAGGKDNVTAILIERPASAPAAVTRIGRPLAMALMLALTILAALVGFGGGVLAAARGWLPGMVQRGMEPPGAPIVVRPGESIMAAVTSAAPGALVLVEPGEYREQIVLPNGVRLVSRVARGATIRPPAGTADGEPLVVASDITGAELSGFRIAGDAGAPLSVGVATRNAAVRLVDLEISGALTAAADLGAGDAVAMTGSVIHDNPGAALVIRQGAAPRLSHNVFTSNAWSDSMSAPVVVEAGASPTWSQNVFTGVAPDAIAGIDAAGRAELPRDNWFVSWPSAASPAVGRRTPGR